MTKKVYLEPTMEVTPIELDCELLQASASGTGSGSDLTPSIISGDFDDIFG